MDTTHLAAHIDHLSVLELRLSNERARLRNARNENERALRRVWIAQTEKEISDTSALIGRMTAGDDIDAMSDDELLAALSA